jgi:hypothetical protein
MGKSAENGLDGTIHREVIKLGIKRVTILTMVMLFFCVLMNACFSQAGVTLEIQPWPAPKECKTCVPLQFGRLEMHLPLQELERILIIEGGGAILHVMPKTNSPKVGFQFLRLKPDKLIGSYKKSGLLQGLDIKTNEELFDTLGMLPGKNKSLKMLRHIENIDTAEQYTKTSKNSVHVYWIRSPLPKGSQRIYFVIDGEETVYLLAGDVTQKFYEAVLSNLRIVDIP